MKDKTHSEDYKTRFLDCDDRFNTIFKFTSVASKIIGPDLTILKVNEPLVKLLGYPASEIEGSKILDFACEEYKSHWHELQEALWDHKVPYFKLEVCLIKKNKSLVWVDITTILFEDNGATYGFTVLDDITGKKQFEQTEKRLNIALRNSKMAVWEMDMNLNLVFRSEGHDLLFGYEQPLKDWTINAYMERLYEEDRAEFKEAIDQLPVYGAINFQGRILTTGGIIKWINFQGRSEQEADGKPIKFLGTLADITLDKQKERHKEDFISIASHELKTPITGLKASLQLLYRLKDGLEHQVQMLVEQANKSIDKITVLIDDLLSASKAYEDQIQLRRTEFNVARLVEDCSYHLRLGGPQQITITGELSLNVYADAERIERVALSFLNNSLKYALNSKEVQINIECIDSMVKVSVTDQGPGIAKEKQVHIFDRQYHDTLDERQFSGLGIGLYTSAEIIRKHGGEIGVISDPDKGSTFWFTLPANGVR